MTTTTLAVGGDVPLELVDGKAPTELRLLRRGLNPSTKGDYLFDDQAAQAVMAAYRRMGRPWVIADYDHGSLQAKPENPSKSSKAAGRGPLELRDGELWVTDIKWTPEAKAGIEAGEWPSISPAFAHGEDGRPTWLINFGLTGNPALHAPAELIAANVLCAALAAVAPDEEPDVAAPAPATNLGTTTPPPVMPAPTTEVQPGRVPTHRSGHAPATTKVLNMKTKTPAEVAEFFGISEDEAKMMMSGYAEMGSVKQQGEMMMNAVCLSVGLTSGAKQPDVVSRLSALSTLERSVLAQLKATDHTTALGTLSGLVANAETAKASIAELAAVKTAKTASDVDALLKAGAAEKKLTPAEVANTSDTGLRATALSMGDKAVDWLSAHLKERAVNAVLSTVYTQPETKPKDGEQETSVEQLSVKDFVAMSWTERSRLNISAPKVYEKLHAEWKKTGPKANGDAGSGAALVRELPSN